MGKKQHGSIDTGKSGSVGNGDYVSAEAQRLTQGESGPSRLADARTNETQGVGNIAARDIVNCLHCEAPLLRKLGENISNYKKRRHCDVQCMYAKVRATPRHAKMTKRVMAHIEHCALACETLSHLPALDDFTKIVSRGAWNRTLKL
jgi:hypothetical protein